MVTLPANKTEEFDDAVLAPWEELDPTVVEAGGKVARRRVMAHHPARNATLLGMPTKSRRLACPPPLEIPVAVNEVPLMACLRGRTRPPNAVAENEDIPPHRCGQAERHKLPMELGPAWRRDG
jgi:hypothetical protein